MQNIELDAFPTYIITSIPINEIQIRSRKVINKNKYVIIVKEDDPQISYKKESVVSKKWKLIQ